MMGDISYQVKVKCKRYVVGALFEDTNRLFYSFSKKEEWIQINPKMYEFLCKHKIIIEKLNYYEWAHFLERVNEESVATKLLDKIDNSSRRNNLSVYRRILYEEFESRNCFYCGRALASGKIDVDHFIPWSFIKSDNIWNLVLSCPVCNHKKNNKLPDEEYLTDIINRNNRLLIEFHRPDLQNYRSSVITDVYNWAKLNGYTKTWKPDIKVKKMSEKNVERKWDREEVVILVTEYFRTKGLPSDEINDNYQNISVFLKRREEKLTGISASNTFRNYAGIRLQSGRIRCLDPSTHYSGMKGTKLQKEVVYEYLENPNKIITEAKKIYKKYGGDNFISC